MSCTWAYHHRDPLSTGARRKWHEAGKITLFYTPRNFLRFAIIQTYAGHRKHHPIHSRFGDGYASTSSTSSRHAPWPVRIIASPNIWDGEYGNEYGNEVRKRRNGENFLEYKRECICWPHNQFVLDAVTEGAILSTYTWRHVICRWMVSWRRLELAVHVRVGKSS